MWLLTCDGDLFEGKRVWLRPGSTHLLGRTTGRSEGPERIRYIDHKSVSRKHLTIEVGPNKPEDSSKLHVRSQIKLKDGSKIGTTVNGQKFVQETRTLSEKEHTIKLGSYEHLFHLSWHPVTVSFTSTSKKTRDDVLSTQRARFVQTDIKLITEYVTNETTHAIAKKRNTIPALQALLQARWLVSDGFVDALADRVERKGADGTSLLEEDFDANWPKEDGYFAGTGNEPQPRPEQYLRPNQARAEVFHDYLFVFLSQPQHDTLLPVITAGGGKALVFEVTMGETKVEEVVQYVKQVAGHKNTDHFRLSQQPGSGGVVVVRLHERDEACREFLSSIELALDQRGIEQSEFLDVILTVDATTLRRQLKETQDISEPNVSTRPGNSRPQSQALPQQQQQQRAVTVPNSPSPASRHEQQPVHTQPQPTTEEQQPEETSTTAARRRNRRFITQSRFKGFDDFNPSQFSKPASQSPEPSFDNREPSQAPSVQSMDVDQPFQARHTQQNARKRPAPVDDLQEQEEDMYASILTAHGALKRQKTAAAANGQGGSALKSAPGQDLAAAERAKRAKKKAKEQDVMAEIQARRQREDEERRKDEEALREALEGVDIGELKNLAKVEEMDIPARERPARHADDGGQSERWDSAWNGRKNFKKFRTQGQRQDGPQLHRVIVTLEEVPRKGHGIGEEYWLSSSTTSKSKSQSQSARQGASRSQGTGDDDEDSALFRRRLQQSRQEDVDNAPAEEILPEEIAGRARDEGLQAAANMNSTPSQTLGTESQRKAAGKRPATQQGGGPAKKARQSRLALAVETVDLDEDDDDALKFRRRRR